MIACLLTIFVAVALSSAASAQQPHDLAFRYVELSHGTKSVKATAWITEDALVLQRGDEPNVSVPFSTITRAVYEQRRKYAFWTGRGQPHLDHWLTIHYRSDSGGHFLEFEMPKEIAPRLVPSLEAKSGIKIERVGG